MKISILKISLLLFYFCLTSFSESKFGYKKYVEYIPGDIPLIISAPHGGRISPKDIPDRKYGTTVTDTNTDILAREIAADFKEKYGKTPHVIICDLKRTKIDCNRDIKEGAQGNEDAEKTWKSFHGFIQEAREEILKSGKFGFYVDLHAHGHPVQRLELGYLLRGKELKNEDKLLRTLVKKSSIQTLTNISKDKFPDLLRGKNSLGALFAEYKVEAVPSPKHPHPGDEKYFNGGYNTRLYCKESFSGLQVECHKTGVRDTEKNRKKFATVFNKVMIKYLKTHASLNLTK